MDQNLKDLKEGLRDLIAIELAEFGVDESLVKINDSSCVELEESAVDSVKFFEKTNFSKKEYRFKAYTLENSRLIFMPIEPFYSEYRENEAIYEEIEAIRTKANQIIKDFLSKFFEQVQELNEKKTLEERIPSKIYHNFKFTDLSSVSSWKAVVVLSNSAGKDAPKIGEFDNVGYVMVGINTGTIIPIARTDEHHRGYDLISHYLDLGLIPEDTYHPFFSLGHDYVDQEDHVALAAMKIWRKLGGPNIILDRWSSGRDGIEFKLTMDDYIAMNGKVELHRGELLPIGQRMIDHFKNLSNLIVECRSNPLREKAVYNVAIRTFMFYKNNVNQYISDEESALILNGTREAQLIGGEEGLKKLEQLYFGFDSFKNKLHNEVREAMATKFAFSKKDMLGVFGDLELANHLLGSL